MEEFRVCASCSYEKGFQVAFRKVKSRIKIMLICPHCGQSYDIGWATSTVKGFKPEKGLTY